MPLPRLLILPALTALFALALTASPASAVPPPECPCWPEGPPTVEPTFCYQSPTAQTNTFAYLSPPPTFLQVTTFWCRNSGLFRWVTPAQRQLCEQQLQCLCAATNLSSDDLCNGVDDNCNGLIDEDFVPEGTSCGEGVCAATGATFCDGTSGVQNTCIPQCGNPTASDICNGACPDDQDACTYDTCIGDVAAPSVGPYDGLYCDSPELDAARQASCQAAVAGAGFYCYVSERRACANGSTCGAETGQCDLVCE